MNNILGEGILGIVTGILTTVVLYLAKVLWDAKLQPFLAELRYQGVKIDGRWNSLTEEEGHRAEGRLFLNQNAHTLSGTFNFKYNGPDKDFEIDFVVSGYMWEGYVTLNFKPRDRRITSYATSLLKIHGGGQSLVGKMLFRNVEEDTVSDLVLSFARAAS